MFHPTNQMRALHHIIFISKAHHCAIESQVNVSGIHRTPHMLLSYLYHKGEITSQKELAKLLKVSEAAIANSLEKLEKDEFVKRIPLENDRRKNVVVLTEKGSDIIEKTKRKFDVVNNMTFEGISEEEIETLTNILSKITQNLSKETKMEICEEDSN